MSIKVSDIESVFRAEAELESIKNEVKANEEFTKLKKRLDNATKQVKATKKAIILQGYDAVGTVIRKYFDILFEHTEVDAYGYDTVKIQPNREAIINSAEADAKRMKRLINLYNKTHK